MAMTTEERREYDRSRRRQERGQEILDYLTDQGWDTSRFQPRNDNGNFGEVNGDNIETLGDPQITPPISTFRKYERDVMEGDKEDIDPRIERFILNTNIQEPAYMESQRYFNQTLDIDDGEGTQSLEDDNGRVLIGTENGQEVHVEYDDIRDTLVSFMESNQHRIPKGNKFYQEYFDHITAVYNYKQTMGNEGLLFLYKLYLQGAFLADLDDYDSDQRGSIGRTRGMQTLLNQMTAAKRMKNS